MANLVIKISDGTSAANIRKTVSFGRKANAKFFLENIANSITHVGSCELQLLNDNAVAASGTLTIVSASDGDTCSVNGVTFTAKTSGATGNQFNIGVSDTASATNLAAAINGSATALVSGTVQAHSALGVVTVTAVKAGIAGNLMTITGEQASIAASGARLTGGLEDTATSVSFKNWS